MNNFKLEAIFINLKKKRFLIHSFNMYNIFLQNMNKLFGPNYIILLRKLLVNIHLLNFI